MEHAGGHELRADAAKALAAMAAASVRAGAGTVGIDTAYRSCATQDALYDKWLARRGRVWADTWYLRPGYSEHQTGLTVDLLPVGRSNCTINDCIDETPQGRWLARNAWRHGFILRYETRPHLDHRRRLRALALPLRGPGRSPGPTTTAAGTPTRSSSADRPRPRTDLRRRAPPARECLPSRG